MNKLVMRIAIGFTLGMLAATYIPLQAEAPISDTELIILAKQKAPINSKELAQFYEKFIDQTKKLYIKYRTQWYIDNKNMAKDLVKALGEKDLTEKEWNPRKYAEQDWQNNKRYWLEKEGRQLTPETLAVLIQGILDRITFETKPHAADIKKQLKQWLEKHK